MQVEMEFARLATGLLIAAFHRPIGDFMFTEEQKLAYLFRQRGFALPAPLPRAKMHTVYFGLGVFVALFQMARIFLNLQ